MTWPDDRHWIDGVACDTENVRRARVAMTVRTATVGACPDFAVAVFDYDGVCTPTAKEFIEGRVGAVPPLRDRVNDVVAEFRRRGVAVVLLSNEFDRDWVSVTAEFPDFDHVLVGSDNGIFKPDRRAFQRVLLAVDCEAAECLVIDDDETNVRVARSIGCQAIHFDPTDVDASWEAILSGRPVSVM